MWFSVWVFVYTSIFTLVRLFFYLFFSESVSVCLNATMPVPVGPSVRWRASVYLSACLSSYLCPSVWLSVRPSFCPSPCMSLHLPVRSLNAPMVLDQTGSYKLTNWKYYRIFNNLLIYNILNGSSSEAWNVSLHFLKDATFTIKYWWQKISLAPSAEFFSIFQNLFQSETDRKINRTEAIFAGIKN